MEDDIIENKQAIEMCAIYRDIISGTMDDLVCEHHQQQSEHHNEGFDQPDGGSWAVLSTDDSFPLSGAVPNVAWFLLPESSAGFWIVMGISVNCALLAFIFMYKKRMFK